jgi:hypothetical protein
MAKEANIQVSASKRKKWKLLRDFGDIAKIAGTYNMSITTVGAALSTGRMSMRTYEAINAYYSNKKESVLID